MASRTLPLLYLNLGGEMMYVLDQRLVAQKVDGAKAAKGKLTEIYRQNLCRVIITSEEVIKI